jgi:hypothetical protein
VPATYKHASFYDPKDESTSKQKLAHIRESFELYCCILRDLCVEVGEKAKEGRIIAWAKRLGNYDLFELMSLLSAADELLLRTVADSSLRDLRVFKRTLASMTEYPVEPISDILGLLKPHLLAWFRESSETDFAKVHEAFVFLSRLNLTGNVFCADKAAELWWQCNDKLRQNLEIGVVEQKIIAEWFPLENFAILCEGFDPHHGAGTTAERCRANGEKAGLMGLDEKLFAFLQMVGWDPTFTGVMQRPWYRVPGELVTGEIPIDYHRVILVPKNWKTYRIVSEEPTAYMWAQLGAARAIQRYLKMRISGISRHYCVDSESDNRMLAQEGSKDGRWATLDESNASDLISLEVVTEFFRGSCLEPIIELLRTQYAQFDDESPLFSIRGGVTNRVRVRKFAPMGSGICFLIESIVFCAILEGIARSTPGANHYYKVYGDDIVCHADIAEKVMQRLVELGMEPNKAKSFFNYQDGSTDFFRESCGGEYLNGIDVTPKRISRKFSGFSREAITSLSDVKWTDMDPRSIAQLISLANDLFERPTARTRVLRAIKELGIPVLFDRDGTKGIKSLNPDNHHLLRRYNADWQRWEVKAAVCYSQPKCMGRLDLTDESWRSADEDPYHYVGYLDDWDGEVRLFEYLRLANKSLRRHLWYPEDTVSERMDPYSAELRAAYLWIADDGVPVTS